MPGLVPGIHLLSRGRSAKISKTTPCKVAGGGWRSTRRLDTSGNSGAYFQYSEIYADAPERRILAVRRRRVMF
ncbi:hypothetical protein AB7M56_002006 [Bradyrhizobium elkanii]|nr:hypothetical protein [Bradyrhizobium elkanii]MCS3524100.1 hypothetical protein [Bradyrhizobium elkanii]MCS4071756.1 hypothetical protein [Bradyrhizobium elkanii]MCS4078388.1 hypothetical protein [Bradyrhizobium elkanii]MCS4110690.1 hypothetical protein [Bradyrhizobium elkanii]